MATWFREPILPLSKTGINEKCPPEVAQKLTDNELLCKHVSQQHIRILSNSTKFHFILGFVENF